MRGLFAGTFGRAGRRRADRSGAHFLVRWVLAVAVAVTVAGLVEYEFSAQHLERSIVKESTAEYLAEVHGLEEVLAADLAPQVRQQQIKEELEHLVQTYGTQYVALFDAEGAVVGVAGEDGQESEGGPEEDAVDPRKVRSVASSEQPITGIEEEEGEAGEEGRYEFLLPVRVPGGTLVLEMDQNAEVVGDLLSDLRLAKATGLLIAVLLAVPLSYLLGGRALHRRQRHAERTADTDALTGLAGRRPFRPALEAALADPTAVPVTLALLDIDEFKQVNDRLGHSYGDLVLIALAESCEALRASDTAFRLGGDEFAVVLPHSDDETAVEVLERVRRALAIRAPGITFSCGVASARPDEAVAVQELWERSDAALYEAKRRGRRQTVTFTAMSSSLTVSVDKLEAVSVLLAADSAITVAFQPIWDLHQGSVLGHEALLRLPPDTPIGGPQEAFDLAERLGLAAELDARARRAVLQSVRARDWQGLLFINIHPAALRPLDVQAFAAEVTAAGLEPADVILEVTEQASLDNPELIRVLKRARALGFRLALDDMGQGNAGLRALTHVGFDVVKIDRAVIARLGTDPASDATVAAATTFVQRSGGWVIAEGIEDLHMLDAVRDGTHGPTYTLPVLAGQGYLLGRPAATPLAIDTRLDVISPSDPEFPPIAL
jgi:diguanylate cyclase (GGDEF)-like protein